MELQRENHFLRLNITSSWIHFQLASSALIFKVLTFEIIFFSFSCISLGEKTRKFYPVEPFFCMSFMKCLSKCHYSKEPVLPCAPILTFVPISGFFANLPIYRKLSFRQKQILGSTSYKNLQKKNNGSFFIQLLNAWLHFTNNNSPAPTSVKEIIDQSIFLNPLSKLITCFL